MRGTIKPINKATLRPLLIAGVEKRLLLLNATLCFPLIAATRLKMPAVFIGVMLFAVIHLCLIKVSKYDPQIGLVFKRATRFSFKPFFPAMAHVSHQSTRKVMTLSKLW